MLKNSIRSWLWSKNIMKTQHVSIEQWNWKRKIIFRLLKTVPLIWDAHRRCFPLTWATTTLQCLQKRRPASTLNLSYPNSATRMAVETLPCFEATNGFFAAGEWEDFASKIDTSKELNVLYNNYKCIYVKTRTNKQACVNDVISDITWSPSFYHSSTNLVIPVLILSYRY